MTPSVPFVNPPRQNGVFRMSFQDLAASVVSCVDAARGATEDVVTLVVKDDE